MASSHGQGRFYEGETFGKTLAMIVDGGEQVIIANLPPQVARKLAINCRQGRP